MTLKIASKYRQKLQGFNNQKELDLFLAKEPKAEYLTELIL